MLAAAELPAEFHGPVAYFDRWLWLALLGIVVVAVYYVVVLLLTRAQRSEPEPWRPPEQVDPRSSHLGEIDALERAARAGTISLREAHQQLSEVVRGYVAEITPLPARTMSLADFKAAAPGELAQTIELMYPPEFAPDDVNQAAERFDIALHHARRLVSTWR